RHCFCECDQHLYPDTDPRWLSVGDLDLDLYAFLQSNTQSNPHLDANFDLDARYHLCRGDRDSDLYADPDRDLDSHVHCYGYPSLYLDRHADPDRDLDLYVYHYRYADLHPDFNSHPISHNDPYGDLGLRGCQRE